MAGGRHSAESACPTSVLDRSGDRPFATNDRRRRRNRSGTKKRSIGSPSREQEGPRCVGVSDEHRPDGSILAIEAHLHGVPRRIDDESRAVRHADVEGWNSGKPAVVGGEPVGHRSAAHHQSICFERDGTAASTDVDAFGERGRGGGIDDEERRYPHARSTQPGDADHSPAPGGLDHVPGQRPQPSWSCSRRKALNDVRRHRQTSSARRPRLASRTWPIRTGRDRSGAVSSSSIGEPPSASDAPRRRGTWTGDARRSGARSTTPTLLGTKRIVRIRPTSAVPSR